VRARPSPSSGFRRRSPWWLVGGARGGALVLACMPASAAALPLAVEPPVWPTGPGWRGRAVVSGVVVDFAVEPLAEIGRPASGPGEPSGTLREGRLVRFRLALTDAETGYPLDGLYPAAWMDLRPPEAAAPDDAGGRGCAERVETLLGGSLLSRAELDLNAYYVVAMNHDATLSVVDPLFGYGGSKLLALVELRAPAEDWALAGDRLFVTQPGADEVAVVETSEWRASTHVPVGPRPARAVLQPDGGYLWVAYEGTGPAVRTGVSVVAVANLAERARIVTGRGPHDVAISGDSRRAFVTNGGDGTVSVIDVARLEVVATLPTAPDPVSIAWCEAAGVAWVGHADGTLAAIAGDRPAVAARLTTEPGLAQVRCAPGGRYAFAVNSEADLLHVIDGAGRRIVKSGPVADRPDQLAFSRTLAYVRHLGSDVVLMVPLADAAEAGTPLHVVDFPGGSKPPGEGPPPARAAAIVKAPGADAVLVANPADGMIYYYSEGMAAPRGAFENYGRAPRAVTVVDNSLRPRAPGVYETTARLRRPGTYDLALLLDTPRAVHCFEVEVAPDPEADARRRRVPLRVAAPDAEKGLLRARAGEEIRLELTAEGPGSAGPRAGLADLELLVIAGGWHVRRPARDLGGGRYEVALTVPSDGLYYLYAECPSEGLLPGTTRPLAYLVAGDAADAE